MCNAGGKHYTDNDNLNMNKGFTLIEAMVAAAVLSLGIILIYEGLFAAWDSFDYYANYLDVLPWADENISQAKHSLTYLGPDARIAQSGEFISKNKNFKWSRSYNLIDEDSRLYRIDLAVSWPQGQRTAGLSRNTYAMYARKQ